MAESTIKADDKGAEFGAALYPMDGKCRFYRLRLRRRRPGNIEKCRECHILNLKFSCTRS